MTEKRLAEENLIPFVLELKTSHQLPWISAEDKISKQHKKAFISWLNMNIYKI
jgi:hypothetical protein